MAIVLLPLLTVYECPIGRGDKRIQSIHICFSLIEGRNWNESNATSSTQSCATSYLNVFVSNLTLIWYATSSSNNVKNKTSNLNIFVPSLTLI